MNLPLKTNIVNCKPPHAKTFAKGWWLDWMDFPTFIWPRTDIIPPTPILTKIKSLTPAAATTCKNHPAALCAQTSASLVYRGAPRMNHPGNTTSVSISVHPWPFPAPSTNLQPIAFRKTQAHTVAPYPTTNAQPIALTPQQRRTPLRLSSHLPPLAYQKPKGAARFTFTKPFQSRHPWPISFN